MQITISKHQGTHITCFSPLCEEVMNFFLTNHTLYFTPSTVALSMERSINPVKVCMNLLRKNSYLSKETGTIYHITKENMEFWSTDFKNYLYQKLK